MPVVNFCLFVLLAVIIEVQLVHSQSGNNAAIFVSHFSRAVPGNPLHLNQVVVNYGNGWNPSTYKYTTAAEGIHYVSMTVTPYAPYSIAYTLVVNQQSIASISRSTSFYLYDTASRDIAVNLKSADEMWIASGYNSQGGATRLTSLSIFSISDAMAPSPVAFSLARNATTSGFQDPVDFNVELVKQNSQFSQQNIFKAPSDGIYYFSFSVGLINSGTANFMLYKNDQPFVNIVRGSTSQAGTDTIGRSIMAQLQKNDRVHIVNDANQVAYSSTLLETSFSGFLYEPAHGNKVAWCVARTSNIQGVVDPMPFETVLVNEGNAWNPSTNQVTIPRAGYYFIHISSGVQSASNLNLGIMIGSAIPIQLFRYQQDSPNVSNGIDTMSRSGILNLSTSTILRVKAFYQAMSYSDPLMQTTFIGFLLYET